MTNDTFTTTYEGRDGYALVDKAQFEWLRREVDRLTYLLNGMKRDAKCYETAFDDAEDDVKQSVQKQMAELRAENARLKQELEDYQRDGDHYWLSKPSSQ